MDSWTTPKIFGVSHDETDSGNWLWSDPSQISLIKKFRRFLEIGDLNLQDRTNPALPKAGCVFCWDLSRDDDEVRDDAIGFRKGWVRMVRISGCLAAFRQTLSPKQFGAPNFYGEFDSGSERTLAAWIRHASRTGLFL